MRTPIRCSLLVIAVALAACGGRTAARPTVPAVAWDDGAPRALAPARADTKAMVSTCVRIYTAPADRLAAAGLPTGGGPVVLPAEVTEQSIGAAIDEDLLLPRLTGMSGQRHSAYEMNQIAFLADYRLVNGLAKPEIQIAGVGTCIEVLARVVDGRLPRRICHRRELCRRRIGWVHAFAARAPRSIFDAGNSRDASRATRGEGVTATVDPQAIPAGGSLRSKTSPSRTRYSARLWRSAYHRTDRILRNGLPLQARGVAFGRVRLQALNFTTVATSPMTMSVRVEVSALSHDSLLFP
jgi:hypothetical protein